MNNLVKIHLVTHNFPGINSDRKLFTRFTSLAGLSKTRHSISISLARKNLNLLRFLPEWVVLVYVPFRSPKLTSKHLCHRNNIYNHNKVTTFI